tara:strand:+ start:5953 stop:6633 length:681 start_codon:yes stop_codon:yes gene_type:complete
MAVSVASVIDRVQATIQDTVGIRWPESELVLWVNDAQREIVLFKPDANAANETITLVDGTKQSIPTDGNRLLRVIRNMSSSSGGNGGRSIRLVASEILDAQAPNWHDPAVTGDAAHTAVVKHYIYDEQNPRNFYVYPGVSGNSYIEIVYSKNPTTVTASDDLSIPDLYANSIMDYVLYRAYSKDAEYAANNQRSGQHYQLFIQSVTGKAQVDQVTTPNYERDTGRI